MDFGYKKIETLINYTIFQWYLMAKRSRSKNKLTIFLILVILVLAVVAGVGWTWMLKAVDLLKAEREAKVVAAVTYSEEPVSFGDGTVNSYVTLMQHDENSQIPIAIGLEFSGKAFNGLSTEESDRKWCATENGEERCLIGHETVLQLPKEASITPLKWLLLNWNPNGHIPTDVYDVPHFDFHFYIMDKEKRNEIKPGLCEDADPAVTIDCESFERGMISLPPNFLPKDYVNVGAVEAGMGNHLIDLTSPEFETDFTHTWIYGTFDGEITYLEPMITREFLLDKPNLCVDIKQPRAFVESGWYPTQYCMRYHDNTDTYTISIEAFVRHQASEPEPTLAPIPDSARGPAIDPDKGYFVEEIKDGLYWVTEGTYQVMFLTTGEGVIVVDAPPSIGENILNAIKEVTDEPITHVIYSHSHADHIAAASMYPKNAVYIAHEETAANLARSDDPYDFGVFLGGSPVPEPTITFSDTYTLEVGSQTLELEYKGVNHNPGNIFIYAPEQEVLMFIDIIFPGWSPFKDLAVTSDVTGFVDAHDDVLSYDFDTLVSGHVGRLGTSKGRC